MRVKSQLDEHARPQYAIGACNAERPKVAVLSPISGLGGGELGLLETMAHLRAVYDFHLIIPGDGPLKQRAESEGARTWILPWPESIAGVGETARLPGALRILKFVVSLRPFARKLSNLLDEIGPSIFVTNSIKAHLIGALAHERGEVPLVWYVRDGLEQRVISRKVLAGLSRRCDMAVCASRYVASQFRRYVSPLVPTTVVYDIVDLGRFRPEAAAPPDLTKEPGDIWFGIVGAITPLKGQDIFLNAAERVLRHLPNSIFLIAGNNPYVTESGMAYEKSLRSKVENSILRNRVKWLGFRNDTPNVMARLDVLVQPNRGPEGLGRSVLEAMACKVPVIAANQWGPAEVIEDSGSGLLFPPLDMEQLTDHMVALGKSGSLREILGKRGHDWIHRNLIATELAGKFDRILAEAIGRQRQEVMA